MIIDCISDLHGFYPDVGSGDLLIICGDLTARDEPDQYLQFNEWLRNQEYKRKIVIAGNHDNCLQSGVNVFINPLLASSFVPIYGPGLDYLCDSGTEFEGLKIWGTPWTKTFEGMNPKCKAFTCETEEELAEKWALIPENIDILITHGPPHGSLDQVYKDITNKNGKKKRVHCFCGSTSFANRIEKVPRPRMVVFGHIHEQGGKQEKYGSNTILVNCSIVNEEYQHVHKPVRIEI